MAKSSTSFIESLNSNWRVKLFFLMKIPSAFFMGIRVSKITHNDCIIDIPFRWFTKNPFKSIYFACQCAAAELSTGFLLAAKAENYGKVSMLVVNMECEFVKKADDRSTFTCSEGPEIDTFLKSIFESKQPAKLTLTTKGVTVNGQPISNFKFTWSVKPKF